MLLVGTRSGSGPGKLRLVGRILGQGSMGTEMGCRKTCSLGSSPCMISEICSQLEARTFQNRKISGLTMYQLCRFDTASFASNTPAY